MYIHIQSYTFIIYSSYSDMLLCLDVPGWSLTVAGLQLETGPSTLLIIQGVSRCRMRNLAYPWILVWLLLWLWVIIGAYNWVYWYPYYLIYHVILWLWLWSWLWLVYICGVYYDYYWCFGIYDYTNVMFLLLLSYDVIVLWLLLSLYLFLFIDVYWYL